MKTYTGSCTSYSINELSEAAQEKAYQKWHEHNDVWAFWWDEAKASLDKFCDIFDVKLRNWEFDGYYMAHWRLEITNNALADDEAPLSGIRLAKYIWNNYSKYILKGKYYSLWSKTDINPHHTKNGHAPYGKLKQRYSRIMVKMDDCPLTGVYYDCSLLNHMVACLHYKETYDSYKELINDCIHEFFEDCMTEYERNDSKEFFLEEAEANEYEYDEDGRAFYLPNKFVEAI